MDEPVQRRPRILLIARNLPPLRGGMERLNRHIVTELDLWAEVTVVGPVGCRSHLPHGVVVHEVPIRPLWKFLLASTMVAWREAAKGMSIAMAGSGLTAPVALMAAWRARSTCVAYVHGLDVVAQHPVYRCLWMPALRRLDAAFANSNCTANLAKRAGVANGNVVVLHPGARIPGDQHSNNQAFRTRFELGEGPVLLSVGRLTERKGIPEFVAAVLPGLIAIHPDIRLVVIGDDAPDALQKDRLGGGERLTTQIASLHLQDYVSRIGSCDEATLEAAYAAADVHVFPIREIQGDIEGFGMVAIEAAAHGLPTVAFAVGGVPDAVLHAESGYLVAPHDYDAFAARVCDVIAAGRDSPMRNSARAFASGFDWGRFGERLRAGMEILLRAGG